LTNTAHVRALGAELAKTGIEHHSAQPAPRPRPDLTLTPRRSLAGTLTAWGATTALLLLHFAGALPLGMIGVGCWCSWLLAIGGVGFWTTFLRVTSRLIAEDWQIGRVFGDLSRLPVTDIGQGSLITDPGHGDGFVREGLWPVFVWLGGVLWGGAALYTGDVASGQLHPRPSDLLLTLFTILWPAAACTAAAINGPPLTRQRAVRRAAALAHHQMRERDAETEVVVAVRTLAQRDPQRAEALLRDITAQARTAAGPCTPIDLHVVNGLREQERRDN